MTIIGVLLKGNYPLNLNEYFNYSSKFEEVTEVLDDCIPDAIPGSSVSLSDSLHPDHESVLEI